MSQGQAGGSRGGAVKATCPGSVGSGGWFHREVRCEAEGNTWAFSPSGDGAHFLIKLKKFFHSKWSDN